MTKSQKDKRVFDEADGLVGSTEPFSKTLLEFTAKNDCTKIWYQAVVDWVRRYGANAPPSLTFNKERIMGWKKVFEMTCDHCGRAMHFFESSKSAAKEHAKSIGYVLIGERCYCDNECYEVSKSNAPINRPEKAKEE